MSKRRRIQGTPREIVYFFTGHGSLAVINESPNEVVLDSMYKVCDSLGLKASYSRSEYV